jgi:hypothetical protein
MTASLFPLSRSATVTAYFFSHQVILLPIMTQLIKLPPCTDFYCSIDHDSDHDSKAPIHDGFIIKSKYILVVDISYI